MKKIKRTALLGLTLILSLVVITGCSTKDKATDTKDSSSTIETKAKTEEIEVSVSLIKDDKELSQKTISIPKDTTLMAALQGNFEVVDKGGMITSIDGVEQNTDDGLFWTYTINDEMVNTGAKDTKLSNGDKVVFTYAKF